MLSDVVQSQVALHAPYGGVVPELASRDHLRNVGPVVREALADARGDARRRRRRRGDATGPGLVGALLVGVQAAKGLAWAAGKPLVGVDHLIGHLLVGVPATRRRRRRRPDVPVRVRCSRRAGTRRSTAWTRPRPDAIAELGATRDDAAGEAFDKVAKLLGLGYPGGPVVDRLAATGDASRVTLVAADGRARLAAT